MGSGTGLLSQLFLGNGNWVFGVEPNAEMRHAGEGFLAGYEHFTIVAATVEATTLSSNSVGFIAAGQSFHWFDPIPTRAEFVRVLKPGGWVVLVWNTRKATPSSLSAAYEKLIELHGTDYDQVNHGRRGGSDSIRQFFDPEDYETVTLENRQVFDFEGMKGRLLSSSYAPNEGDAGYPEMVRDLGRIFSEYERNGKVDSDYDTKVHYGRLEPA